jgi:hypothetical protein
MLIPVLFLSTIFFICYFLTIIPKRPFILTKVIEVFDYLRFQLGC